MNREQVAQYIMALNDLAKYVPPIVWAPIANSPVMQALLSAANGQVELTTTPIPVKGGNDAVG